MDRRDFIKNSGIGFGSLVLSTTFLNSCNTTIPKYLMPWKGPTSLQSQDIRKAVLSYAILAANPHNKQSWIIKFTGTNSFDLFIDMERLLPETDPLSRQSHIGQGTFLENIKIAAPSLGYSANITYFPKGAYSNSKVVSLPIASIRLEPISNPKVDPLFTYITKRQSNKRIYENRSFSDKKISKLIKKHAFADIPVFFSDDNNLKKNLVSILTEAMKVEVSLYKRHMETVNMFRFGDTELEKHRDGFGVGQSGITGLKKWMVETFFLSKEGAGAADSSFAKTTIDLTHDQAESAAAYGWIISKDNSRLKQVMTGHIYQRINLQTAQLGIAQHPLSQPLQEYTDMIPLYNKLYSLLEVPKGHTLQMLFRLGYAEQVTHAPRREISEIIRS